MSRVDSIESNLKSIPKLHCAYIYTAIYKPICSSLCLSSPLNFPQDNSRLRIQVTVVDMPHYIQMTFV